MKSLYQYIKEALNNTIELNIFEGGHVFDGGSDRIAKEDIKPTLNAFLDEMSRLFPEISKRWYQTPQTLGSVGKKDYSGDIDIAINIKALDDIDDWNIDKQEISTLFEKFKKRARTSSADQIMKRAVITAISNYINNNSDKIVTNSKQAGSNMLFSQFNQIDHITNKENGKTVQIDTMFGDVDWLKFAYYSDTYTGNIKGLHRTQLMLHLFSYKGYMFKHNDGVIDKETREKVADTPKDAIKLLNKLYNINLTESILSNYNKLFNYLKEHLDEETFNGVIDIYLQTLDHTRCDIPDNLQPYWIENQDRLGLKGKFLPEDSNLYPLRRP